MKSDEDRIRDDERRFILQAVNDLPRRVVVEDGKEEALVALYDVRAILLLTHPSRRKSGT